MKKKTNIKNKRALLIAAVTIGAIGIVGTIAFNMDSISFANLFHTGDSREIYVDTFDSPDNWQPCEEISKTATATNKNDTVRYARMKIDEYWRVKNSQTSADDHTTSDLALTWTDASGTHYYAIINTQNDSSWELREDGWYYYKTPLVKDETTLSLLRSVTLNCDATLVTNGTPSATTTGQVGESVPTAYADATYHVYVTMEMSDVEWPVQPHTADCQGNLLYDAVACQTNGIDDGSDEHQNSVNFTTAATSGTNGFGVNTLAAHANDVYPTYYYRGAVDNNYVAWNGYCWRIIRTTETGGVKMIIVGQTTDGPNGTACYAIGEASKFSGGSTVEFNPDESSYKSLTEIGYMRGATPVDSTDQYGIIDSTNYSYYFANDVSYDSATDTYTLTDTMYGPYSTMRMSAAGNHHYTCLNRQTSCNSQEAVYIYAFASQGRWLKLGGAEDIEDLKSRMFSNSVPSTAKSAMEGWFGGNLANKENELEDTIYCNDRQISYGGLISNNMPAITNYTTTDSNDVWSKKRYSSILFAAYSRNAIKVNGNFHPSIDCANKRDSFTKNETATGNGKLSYMVGMITLDEMTLAGAIVDSSSSDSYLNFGSGSGDYWTMTPTFVDTDSYFPYIPVSAAYNSGGPRYQYWGTKFGVRPVVSLKKGTHYVVGGTGTISNPYVIE